MAGWFHRTVVETGRLPLFCFFAGFLVAFLFIRFSVRMIRAEVRWWPGNVSSGGTHIHHVVFGVVFMLVGGVGGLAITSDLLGWRSAAAALFGIGSALVLDEFALILHLQDVYWSREGRTSVDAVFVAVALCGLMLAGVRPVFVDDVLTARQDDPSGFAWIGGVVAIAIDLTLVAITVFKGKTWTGLIGLFVPILLLFGAIRLARPASPWARWRYRPDRRRGARKLARAQRREDRYRRPVVRAKIRIQELIAGSFR